MLKEQIHLYDKAQLILKAETLDFASMIDVLTTALRRSWTSNVISTITRGILEASAPGVVETYEDAQEVSFRSFMSSF